MRVVSACVVLLHVQLIVGGWYTHKHTRHHIETKHTITPLLCNLFGQVAGPSRRVNDLVIEDGEVERQTQSDRMGRLHFRLGNIEGLLIGFLRVLDDRCAFHKRTQNYRKEYRRGHALERAFRTGAHEKD